MSALYNNYFTEPNLDFRSKVVRCRNWLEVVLKPESQGETLTIQADSLGEAQKIAQYCFYMSPDLVVARW